MLLSDEPRIGTHCRILDQARFACAPDVAYRPSGQETGSADTIAPVMDAYGVRRQAL